MTSNTLPDHGAEHPQVTVTIPLAELRDSLNAHQIGQATMGGYPISPTTARRLACDAEIIPAVLGSHSEVLNLGRSTPTWNRAQRRALRLQDQGCTFPNCQATLNRCQIHHHQHWSHDDGHITVQRNIDTRRTEKPLGSIKSSVVHRRLAHAASHGCSWTWPGRSASATGRAGPR
jgi:Domain of unknown function (DUF222)